MQLLDEFLSMLREYGKDAALVIVSLLGGSLISLYFYRKALQRQEISYACDHDRLVWSRPAASKIELLYEGRHLRDPHRVLYYIWNSGNCSIEGQKISACDPLRLSAQDIEVLNASVVRTTREALQARAVQRLPNETLIGFDFLDPGDGFVIEVVYDDPRAKPLGFNVLEFLGTIKGIKESPKQRDLTFESKTLRLVGQSTAIFASFAICLLLLGFQIYDIVNTSPWFLLLPKILTSLVLIIASIGMIVALTLTVRATRVPIKLKPPGESNRSPKSHEELIEQVATENERLSAEIKLLARSEHEHPREIAPRNLRGQSAAAEARRLRRPTPRIKSGAGSLADDNRARKP
jgi:hypothetical protein